MGTVTTLITFEEFERLPDKPGTRELLRGELIELPPAKRPHSRISKLFFLTLHAGVEQLRRDRPELQSGETYFETGFKLSPSTWLQPDVSLTHPGQPFGDYFQGAPLLAIEVVSESNTADSIEGKVQEYLAHGSREVWVVYPKRKSVRVYRVDGTSLCETTLTTDLLPTFSLDLRALFESA
jgi:Uma2 family endonuclease